MIETFYEKLRPGGYLLLGHSESLINVSSAFELKHLTRDLVAQAFQVKTRAELDELFSDLELPEY